MSIYLLNKKKWADCETLSFLFSKPVAIAGHECALAGSCKTEQKKKGEMNYFSSGLDIVTMLTFAPGDRCNYSREENGVMGLTGNIP